MNRQRIIAVVLTYDKYRVLAEHMVARYRDLWPDHPFLFRIPYQENTRFLGGPHELVKTPPGIKDTVLGLLEDLADEDWIYWTLDDKYPVSLDLEPIERLSRWILAGGAPPDFSGALFCRCRHMLIPSKVRSYVGPGPEGVPLLERSDYQQIWVHQFVRVGVIRRMFRAFPDKISQANVMDEYKDRLVLPKHHRLFVTKSNHASFGESTDAGQLTRNCVESLERFGFEVPSLPRCKARILLGETNPWLFRGTVLAKRLPAPVWPLLGALRPLFPRPD